MDYRHVAVARWIGLNWLKLGLVVLGLGILIKTELTVP
jgi:hypothetical protein